MSTQNLLNNTIVKHLAGSRAYGTSTPTSDTDYRGIFIADPVNIRTPFYPVREVNDITEEDTVLYELNQYFKLASDANPNVLETLFIRSEEIVITTPAYELIREHRNLFLSKKIAFTTSGYALSQIKRLRNAHKNVNYQPQLHMVVDVLTRALKDNLINHEWIASRCGEGVKQYISDRYDDSSSAKTELNLYDLLHQYGISPLLWVRDVSPLIRPLQCEHVSLVHNFTEDRIFKFNSYFYRKDHRLIPYGKDVFGVFHQQGYSLFNNRTGHLNVEDYENLNDHDQRKYPLFIVKFNREVYEEQKRQHDVYWSWRNGRNEKRGELEEQYGYDTKWGMHAVRLLRTGQEVLKTGEYNVYRPDAEELLEIRNGSWSYERLMEFAESTHKDITDNLLNTTQLPDRPNIEQLSKLLMEAQDLVWNTKTN